MPVIPVRTASRHRLPGTSFTSLATPSRGCVDTAVWEVVIEAGTPPTPTHRVTREEVFVVLQGTVTAEIDGVTEVATVRDAIVIPADTDFWLSNSGTETVRMLCCLPVGGQVCVTGEDLFTPPWAQ